MERYRRSDLDKGIKRVGVTLFTPGALEVLADTESLQCCMPSVCNGESPCFEELCAIESRQGGLKCLD